MKITENDVLRALWVHGVSTPHDRWVMVPQVAVDDESREATLRRIDMLAIRSNSNGDPRYRDAAFESLAIEVKVTRADFLADVRNPAKQQPWRDLAHRHAYAVPTGLVALDEVPPESGLIEVTFLTGPSGATSALWRREAPLQSRPEDWSLPRPIWRSLLQRLSSFEATGRGWNPSTYLPVGFAADLRQARADVESLESDLDEVTRHEQFWRTLYANALPDGASCHLCGCTVDPTAGLGGWQHRDADDAQTCAAAARSAAAAYAKARFRDASDEERDGQLDIACARTMERLEPTWGSEGAQAHLGQFMVEPWRAFMEAPEEPTPVLPRVAAESPTESKEPDVAPVWFSSLLYRNTENTEPDRPYRPYSGEELSEAHLHSVLFAQVREVAHGLDWVLRQWTPQDQPPSLTSARISQTDSLFGLAMNVGFGDEVSGMGIGEVLGYLAELESGLEHMPSPGLRGTFGDSDEIAILGISPLGRFEPGGISGDIERLSADYRAAIELAQSAMTWLFGLHCALAETAAVG